MLMGFSLIKLMGSQFMPGSHNTIAARTIFSSKIVPSVGLAGVIGVQHMIHTCTRRFYHANFSQKLLNSAATTPSLNLWAQRCLRFCKRNKGSLLFGAFAACVTLSYVRIQRVPYLRQIQLVTKETTEERRAEDRWKTFMERYKEDLLPLSDPRSIRAQSVATNLIRALKVGLRLEKECKVNGQSCEDGDFREYRVRCEWERDNVDHINSFKYEGGNLLSDRELLWKPSTKHLDGKDWEVYVLDCPDEEDALHFCHFSHFNKRIVIPRGLLDSLKSDAELALFIGHEIGHIVGRHVARIYIRFCWNIYLLTRIFQEKSGFEELFWAYTRRWNEREANHIGIMLMASAGYDPQTVIGVLEKSGQTFNKNLLKEAEEMDEVFAVFKKVKDYMNLRSMIYRSMLD